LGFAYASGEGGQRVDEEGHRLRGYKGSRIEGNGDVPGVDGVLEEPRPE
jgi:hypothetical protein